MNIGTRGLLRSCTPARRLLLTIGLDDVDTTPTAHAAVYEIVEPGFRQLAAGQTCVPVRPSPTAFSQPGVVSFGKGQANPHLLAPPVPAKDKWIGLLVPDFLQAVGFIHRHASCLTTLRLSAQDDRCWQLPTLTRYRPPPTERPSVCLSLPDLVS